MTLARESGDEGFRALFELSPAGQVETDPDGRLLRVNAAFAQLVGRPAEDLVGRLMRDVTGPVGPDEPRMAERAAAGELAPAAERLLIRPDGERVQVSMICTVVRGPDGGVERLVAALVDVTERNTARAELERLVLALREARAQSDRRAALLNAVLETIDVGVVACDPDGHLELFNRATREFHGLPEDPGLEPVEWSQHYALYDEDGVTPLDPRQVPLYRALVDGQVGGAHITIAPEGQVPRTLRCDGRALTDGQGRVTGAVVAMKDVTELRESEQRFRAAFQDGPTPMARLDPDGTVRDANPALRRLLSVPTWRLLGQPLHGWVHDADRQLLVGVLTGPVKTGRLVELRMLRQDGSPVWCELATTRGTAVGGAPYVLVQLLDVHERKQNERALEQAARRDPLTGLGNRGALDEELGRHLDRAGGRGAAALFIDLDHFKAINDTFGHEAGDAVLVATAARLRSAVRPQDTVIRVGGDEFVVVCPRGAEGQAPDAGALARRLEQVLAVPVEHEGHRLVVGASIGHADGRPGDDMTGLITRADRAMYERKDAGRYAPRARQPAPPRTAGGPDDVLRGLLGDAVERGRLQLHFQPVVDLASSTIVGAEALLRLRDDAGRTIAPDRFIPVAEATGTITALGRWALDRALQQTAVWKAALPADRDFGIGVNLSPLQLYDPDLLTCLTAALDTSGLEPSAVVLELTESRLVPSTAPVHEVLNAVLDLGVHLALDDFGTGYGGISYLSDFPFDLLKVDRRFTSRLTGEGPAGRLARGVFALARETGIVTVAEGVETVEQQRAVLAAGCHLGQGYLWHRPVDAQAMTALLAAE